MHFQIRIFSLCILFNHNRFVIAISWVFKSECNLIVSGSIYDSPLPAVISFVKQNYIDGSLKDISNFSFVMCRYYLVSHPNMSYTKGSHYQQNYEQSQQYSWWMVSRTEFPGRLDTATIFREFQWSLIAVL
jgi:hypothetical protein